MTTETMFKDVEARQAAIEKLSIDGSNQNEVIKEVRRVTRGMSLKEAQTIVAEELYKKRVALAIDELLIDGSNQNEVIKEVRLVIKDMSLEEAQMIVVKELFEKRVVRAMEWFPVNNFDIQEAFFTLAYEFVQTRTQPSRQDLEMIFNEAFRRLGESTPLN